jgi:hypothetical protein
MKNKKIEEIWYQRAYVLDKFFYQTRWLINCNKPLSHKNAILKENFDRFVLTLHSQDKQIRAMVEPNRFIETSYESKIPSKLKTSSIIKTPQDMRKYIKYLKLKT